LDEGPTSTGTIKVLVVGLEGVCGCEFASKKTLASSFGVRSASDIDDDAPITLTVSAWLFEAAHSKRPTPTQPNVVCFIGILPESPGPTGKQRSARVVPNQKVFWSFVYAM
jgi:hypothetical protein